MDRYLTVKETSKLLRRTPNSLYKSISLKEIPSNLYGKFNGKILFNKKAVINFIENKGAI